MPSPSYLKQVTGFSYLPFKLNKECVLKEHGEMWEKKVVMSTVLDQRELDTIWKEWETEVKKWNITVL